MSAAMKEIPDGKKGYVDLYWNDAVAIKVVISRIKSGKMVGSKNFREITTNAAIVEDSALRLAYAAYSRTNPQ